MIHTVFSDVVSPDREAEFNRWYSEVHVPDVTAVPGVLSARRFRLSEQRSALDAPIGGGLRYLVIYEIDTDDPAGVEAELQARVADGRFRPSDTMSRDPGPVALYYDEIP
jgi:hypothetical protein